MVDSRGIGKIMWEHDRILKLSQKLHMPTTDPGD
jgi:hypothetical protein